MMRNSPLIMPPAKLDMTGKKSHSWSPITDLPDDWQSMVDTRVTGLAQAWIDQSADLRESDVLREFVARLCRQFAIETGAIEEIFHITQSATKTLIEHGLDAALLSHEDTQEPTDLVMARINDQFQAIQGVYQFVASQRRLTKSYLLELHQVLTENQLTFQGRDSLGQWVERSLPRGEWKPWPNNVLGRDGFSFEFCPPVQVESEIERLIEMHEQHVAAGVAPIIEAAWLHHRFVLIHPFTDGNGRMARCLASMVLLKAGWLPLVVTRQDKPLYIEALRFADEGDLVPLVNLFGRFQRRMFRQGLDIGEQTLRAEASLSAALDSLRQGLRRPRKAGDRRLEDARAMADQLQAVAMTRIEEVSGRVHEVIGESKSDYDLRLAGAQYEDNLTWHEDGPRKADSDIFCRVWITWELAERECRHVLYLEFCEFGRIPSPVIGCSMAYRRLTTIDDGWETSVPISLSDEMFEFSYASDPADLQRRFVPWLDDCIVNGIRHWSHAIA